MNLRNKPEKHFNPESLIVSAVGTRRGLPRAGRGSLRVLMADVLYQKRALPITCLDAGTHESLLQASTFIQAVEERQGMMISCPEEIAFRRGYIDQGQLMELAEKYKNNSYGDYLNHLANGKV